MFRFNVIMGLADKFRNICIKLGENNKPTYAVMAIATVKGIARPTFTMMDKHEDPETKKYTALREGLTEVVAIPAYWACGELASKIAQKMNVSPEKKALASHNFMFLGVCTAALFVIPALASLAIKPFMKKIQGEGKSKKEDDDDIVISEKQHALNIKEGDDDDDVKTLTPYQPAQPLKPFHPISMGNYTPAKMAGMKVGGV